MGEWKQSTRYNQYPYEEIEATLWTYHPYRNETKEEVHAAIVEKFRFNPIPSWSDSGEAIINTTTHLKIGERIDINKAECFVNNNIHKNNIDITNQIMNTGNNTNKNLLARPSCIFYKEDITLQDNLVFVLMPFTEKWSDYIWEYEIKKTVESMDGYSLTCKRADDLFGHDVMLDVYESIVAARIVVADMTNKNPNVFYEIGMAHALGKEVVLLAQGTEDIPFDLRRFRILLYTNDGPGYQILRKNLPRAIREILSKNNNKNSG